MISLIIQRPISEGEVSGEYRATEAKAVSDHEFNHRGTSPKPHLAAKRGVSFPRTPRTSYDESRGGVERHAPDGVDGKRLRSSLPDETSQGFDAVRTAALAGFESCPRDLHSILPPGESCGRVARGQLASVFVHARSFYFASHCERQQ